MEIMKQLRLYVRLCTVLLILTLGSDLYGQRAKNLSVKRQSHRSYRGNILLLDGSKQLGARLVYANSAIGGEIDFGYLFNERFVAEGGIGGVVESSGNATLLRVPFHVGGKYRLLEKSIFLFYGGIALNLHYQALSGIDTDREISTVAFGPSFFGESAIHFNAVTGLIIRAEQLFITTQKIETPDGKEKALSLLNFSVGLRKTF